MSSVYRVGSETVKNLETLSDTKRSAIKQEDQESYWKSEKDQISQDHQQASHLQVYKGYLCWKIKTSERVVFEAFYFSKFFYFTKKLWCFAVSKLTHLFPMQPFFAPRKHQKTKGFLMFSGGRGRVHWEQMGTRFYILSHSINFEICYVIISIVTRVRAHLLIDYMFWLVNDLVMKHGQLIDIVMSNIFRNPPHLIKNQWC